MQDSPDPGLRSRADRINLTKTKAKEKRKTGCFVGAHLFQESTASDLGGGDDPHQPRSESEEPQRLPIRKSYSRVWVGFFSPIIFFLLKYFLLLFKATSLSLSLSHQFARTLQESKSRAVSHSNPPHPRRTTKMPWWGFIGSDSLQYEPGFGKEYKIQYEPESDGCRVIVWVWVGLLGFFLALWIQF